MRYEYLIIFMGKKGLGRMNFVLDRPITGVEQLDDMDKALREQKDTEGNCDDSIFVINYKLLKSYQV